MSSWWYVGLYRDTAGAGRRDKEPSDDAIPDLVRCPRDGPHPRRGDARRGQGLARGGPGGPERRRVGFRRRTGKPESERRGYRRDGHRGPVPGGRRRTLCRRRALTRGGTEVGCQDRRRLPLRARSPGVHARPGRRELIGQSTFRLRVRSRMAPEPNSSYTLLEDAEARG